MNWLKSKWTATKAWTVRTWKKMTAFFVALLAAFGFYVAYAQPVDFSWTHPTQTVDGGVLDIADIAETRIYCDGALVGAVTAPANVGTLDLSIGQHDCYATTVDVHSQESDPSNTVTKIVLPARPNPPVLE